MKKIDRLKGKRAAINSLMLMRNLIVAEMMATPGYAEAMQDRQCHIDRGELWLTAQTIEFSIFNVRIAMLNSRINGILAIPSKLFRENGTMDKRRLRRSRRSRSRYKETMVITIQAAQ